MSNSLTPEVIERITHPKPFKKSATEEHIFSEKKKAETTAALLKIRRERAGA